MTPHSLERAMGQMRGPVKESVGSPTGAALACVCKQWGRDVDMRIGVALS